MFAIGLSVVALDLSGASVAYTKRQSDAALALDLRARQPKFEITLPSKISGSTTVAIYTFKLVSPESLANVFVYRPRTQDGIKYGLAVTGQLDGDWADDEISLGPTAMGDTTRFSLSCGSNFQLPPFEVRVRAMGVKKRFRQAPEWDSLIPLEPPRSHSGAFIDSLIQGEGGVK